MQYSYQEGTSEFENDSKESTRTDGKFDFNIPFKKDVLGFGREENHEHQLMASRPLKTPPHSPFQHRSEIPQLPSCNNAEQYMTFKK